MNIFVTGAAGFLGSHLCERLLKDGHTVIGVDNFITGQHKNIKLLMSPSISAGKFSFIEHDICIPLSSHHVDDLRRIGIDQIYHLASPASPIDYVQLPLETLFVGSYGCKNILDLACELNARFMLASTSEVYGDPLVHPQPESYWGNVNPIGPRSVYDESKRYAEALTMAYHKSCGADVRICRIFNTYGPRMRANDGRVIPTFINQALNHQPLTVFGNGLQTRSFCYCTDLISGFVALMNGPHIGPFNLGTLYELTMIQLAEAINVHTGNTAGIVFKPLPQNDPTRRKPDLSKTTKLLGWKPEVDFQTGLTSTVQYFASC